MKIKSSAADYADLRSAINWFLGIFVVVLTITFTSEAANVQTSAVELNPAEKFVVDHVRADQVADLESALNADHTKQFPEEKDRTLSAHFLESLLTGALPGVKLNRSGVRIIGATVDDPINLTDAQVPCDVLLEHCQFNKSVTFARTSFAGVVVFDRSSFTLAASFNSIKVGGDARLEAAVFDGPVSFRGADIAGNFQAYGAKFQEQERGFDFSSMKVRGNDTRFDLAVFDGPVYSYKADIARNFSVASAKFLDKKKGVFFFSLTVGGDASLFNAEFDGPAYFTRADIAGNFELNQAKFQNTQFGASFWKLKVGGDATFLLTCFDGPVSFTRAEIIGNFQANGARFQNEQKGADFHSIKVGSDTSFDHTSFEGPVDLRYADFGLLDLSNAGWPKAPAKIQMQAMSYKYIRAASIEPDSHMVLLRLAGGSAYTADVYSRLEDYFLRQGYRGDADLAFIEGKRHERREYLHGLRWLGSCLLDGLVGYGRRPWLAGIPCVLLVALGCVLFSPTKMEPQSPEDTPRVYSRFWYSLGLFLPVVNLQADKVWKPKTDQTFLRNYMRVHILLGWILVPLVLASLTGLIK